MVAIWLAIPYPTHAAGSSGLSLRWAANSTPTTVEVIGLGETTLRQLQGKNWQTEDWQKFLSVYADQGDFIADLSVPPMLGSYRIRDGLIRFQPKFPLERGVTYRAVLRPARLPGGADNRSADIISRFQPPTAPHQPTTVVSQVYPSGDLLPENLLKFYIHFSAPMQGGHIYEHIQLRDGAGKPVELPFLEIDEELWNPEMTRLTLFIDPGRIKRGVQPLEEIGPALEAGKSYTLEIDAAWHDNAGLPLRESFRKSFRVAAPDREPPAPATWKIKPPNAGTRDPLAVIFSEPMDQALALRMIRVADAASRLVEGTSALSDRETRWRFTPRQSWTSGWHQLQVQNTIEDLAGNNIGKVFEVDLFEGVQRRFTNEVVKLSFEIALPVSETAAAATPVGFPERIRRGENFLTNLFDAEIQLLPEYRGSRNYWLFHDNYLAAHLLAGTRPDLSECIRSSLRRFGHTHSGKIEILFNEAPQPLPFRNYVLTNVAVLGDKTIRTEIVTTNVFQGWEEYADLLLLASIAQTQTAPLVARRHFDKAAAMWDGQGLNDRATQHNGIYSTYKLALYLIAADRLHLEPPHRDEAVTRLLAMQSPTGAWITDYKDGNPVGLANVETTCLSLLALKILRE